MSSRPPLPNRIGPFVRVEGARFRLAEAHEHIELTLKHSDGWTPGGANPAELVVLAPPSDDAFDRHTRALPPPVPAGLSLLLLAAVDAIPLALRLGLVVGSVATYYVRERRRSARRRVVIHVYEDDVVVEDPRGVQRPVVVSEVTDVQAARRDELPDDALGDLDPAHAVALVLARREGPPVVVQPAVYGVELGVPALVSMAFALRVLSARQPLPDDEEGLPALLPSSTASTPRADLSPPGETPACVHAVAALVREGGELDLLRCPFCRGAHMPSATAMMLVNERLGLSRTDLEDLAAQYAGRARTCAECGSRTRPVRLWGAMVDLCRGCGSLWLDAGEDRSFLALFDAGRR